HIDLFRALEPCPFLERLDQADGDHAITLGWLNKQGVVIGDQVITEPLISHGTRHAANHFAAHLGNEDNALPVDQLMQEGRRLDRAEGHGRIAGGGMQQRAQLNQPGHVGVFSGPDHGGTSVVDRYFLDDVQQVERQGLVLLDHQRGLAPIPSKVLQAVHAGEQYGRLVEDLRAQVAERDDLAIDLAANGVEESQRDLTNPHAIALRTAGVALRLWGQRLDPGREIQTDRCREGFARDGYLAACNELLLHHHTVRDDVHHLSLQVREAAPNSRTWAAGSIHARIDAHFTGEPLDVTNVCPVDGAAHHRPHLVTGAGRDGGCGFKGSISDLSGPADHVLVAVHSHGRHNAVGPNHEQNGFGLLLVG